MMQRTMVDALPLTTPPERVGARTAVTSRPLPRWLIVLVFWTLIVLAYSTRGEVRMYIPQGPKLGSFEWVRISWLDAFKASIAQWVPWGMLSVAIYWVNH